MPIHPLPQFEADLEELRKEKLSDRLRDAGVAEEEIPKLAELDEEDRRIYRKLNAPSTMVVRFGAMKLVGEFKYRGSAKPGCGSKIVVQTFRGTELGEMLTSTCPNSGCSKSVSRKEMLEYIENSGGRDYPFYSDGKVVRIATTEDVDAQAKIEQSKHGFKMEARATIERLGLPVKIVDAEPILGGERLTFFYMSEDRLEVRDLAHELGRVFETRIDLRQVGARDEARLTADYEKCGQYCCCKNFLKVLKPISMRSAKVQKATLDPMKISGRCGRLMCCLRYEDETYNDLRKRLPNRKKRVGTPEGDGIVLDTQILTQLVKVRLDTGEDRAFPVEELGKPGERPESSGAEREPRAERGPRRDRDESAVAAPTEEDTPRRKRKRRRRGSSAGDDTGSAAQQGGTRSVETASSTAQTGESISSDSGAPTTGDPKPKRKRRRRRRPDAGSDTGTEQNGSSTDGERAPREGRGRTDRPERAESGADGNAASGEPTKKKRRRRRRRRSGGSGEGGGENAGPNGGEQVGGDQGGD